MWTFICHRPSVPINNDLLSLHTFTKKGASLALHLGGSPQTCTRYGKPAPYSGWLIRVHLLFIRSGDFQGLSNMSASKMRLQIYEIMSARHRLFMVFLLFIAFFNIWISKLLIFYSIARTEYKNITIFILPHQ